MFLFAGVTDPESSRRRSADQLEFGTRVVHFVQYLLGSGEMEDDANADDGPSGRQDRHQQETGIVRARRAQRVGGQAAQEGGLAPSGRTRGIPQAQAQGPHGPQPGDWRANQDSGPHPAALYSG